MEAIELRARRARLGIGQADLGALLAVKQVMISRWETGALRIPIGIEVALTSLEDTYDDLVDIFADQADQHEADDEDDGGAIRASDAIEQATITIEGTEMAMPTGMVLSAAATALWLLNSEAEEDGLYPRARII